MNTWTGNNLHQIAIIGVIDTPADPATSIHTNNYMSMVLHLWIVTCFPVCIQINLGKKMMVIETLFFVIAFHQCRVPPYKRDSLKFRRLYMIFFFKLCEKKADSIGFRAYAQVIETLFFVIAFHQCRVPSCKGDSLKFRLLFRVFSKFCEKKADSIGFRAYTQVAKTRHLCRTIGPLFSWTEIGSFFPNIGYGIGH